MPGADAGCRRDADMVAAYASASAEGRAWGRARRRATGDPANGRREQVRADAIDRSRTVGARTSAMIGPTLGRYISGLFLKMIMAVFVIMFSLIYVIDFVDLMRRAGDVPGTTAGAVAYLCLLRTPAAAEQILPFCVLFGAMAAFLNLTRKLELLVARAAGVSVWQFMLPPLTIAALLGIVSIAVYNPLSAAMKRRADGLELTLLTHPGTATDTTIWLRQKSVDGESIVRATASSHGGAELTGVTAFVYDADGRLAQRIDAAQGKLLPGVWQLENVKITTPGETPQEAGIYLLATELQPDQVAQSFAKPDSVPFWELPGLRDRTEAAGLDATGYRLQFQMLLARPLLLVAMVLVAAAFSLRFFRFGGIATMVGGGVGAGFVLYVATKFVGDLGGSGVLSAPLAAWSPAVVANMLGALALLHQEDG